MSHFTQEEAEIYETCTCLDGIEIADVYRKFIKMGGRRGTKDKDEQRIGKRIGHKTARNLHAPSAQGRTNVNVVSPESLRVETGGQGRAVKVKSYEVCKLPEFANNPFAPRICTVFSSDGASLPAHVQLLPCRPQRPDATRCRHRRSEL